GAGIATTIAATLHNEKEPYRVFLMNIRGYKNPLAVLRLPNKITYFVGKLVPAWNVDIAADYLKISVECRALFIVVADYIISKDASLLQGLREKMKDSVTSIYHSETTMAQYTLVPSNQVEAYRARKITDTDLLGEHTHSRDLLDLSCLKPRK